MPTQENNRVERLMPGGVPRYVRVYDNKGQLLDNYTCVFTGRYHNKTGGEFWYLAMNAAPFHPQGIGMHGSSPDQIDRIGNSWAGPSMGRRHPTLGLRVAWQSLPPDVQTCILQTYCYLWDIAVPKDPTGVDLPSVTIASDF